MRVSPGRRPAVARIATLAAIVAGVTLLAPASSGAATSGCSDPVGNTVTCRVPIKVDGYEVKQTVALAPQAPELDGYITHMETDIVNANGTPIPIQRLMLHHIVFLNSDRSDQTCDSFVNWDSESTLGNVGERFYAAGEERAKLDLPPGYGYEVDPTKAWFMTYMVMNHRASLDQGFIQYTYTVTKNPATKPVTPYWLDVRNCRADPIYNVPGTGAEGSTSTVSSDFTMPVSSRIIAAGGHMHGGGRRLTLTEPGCDDRKIGQSVPTWGLADHPFYHVKPILHEPGPISMSAFGTETGIPVRKGETLRLNSRYEGSRPHVRVMGIMVVYAAADPGVTATCGPIPDDVVVRKTDQPGRRGPVPFRIPLTGLDDEGNAVKIDHPPGRIQKMPDGGTILVANDKFGPANVEVEKGARIDWSFSDDELHNVTLANGPKAIGSPNLDDSRTFSRKLRKPGTYRLFCALHPVQMTERIIVDRRDRK